MRRTYHSHLFSGKLSEAREAAIDAVIEPFDAIVIPYVEPGRDGAHRGWISSPNMGEPFDQNRVAEITEALQGAGLWPLEEEEEEEPELCGLCGARPPQPGHTACRHCA